MSKKFIKASQNKNNQNPTYIFIKPIFEQTPVEPEKNWFFKLRFLPEITL